MDKTQQKAAPKPQPDTPKAQATAKPAADGTAHAAVRAPLAKPAMPATVAKAGGGFGQFEQAVKNARRP